MMNVVEVPIENIKPYENNPRDNSKAVEYVKQSIQEFGWQQPLVLDKENVIIVGHTRYLAALELGYDTVPCVIADNLSDAQARAYRLADNKTSDYSVWDNKLLLGELEALDEIDDSIFTGFDWGDTFDNVLDEHDKDVVLNNDVGVMYEITFKSETKDKIDTIISLWEELGESDE